MATGHPKPIPTLSQAQIRRFWSNVEVGSAEECWPWKGKRAPKGHGRFFAKGQSIGAQRIAMFLATGVDPFPLLVCHKCDNPPCCNNNHLFTGSHADNHADRAAKNRTASGVSHGHVTHPDAWPTGDTHWTRRHPERLKRGPNHPRWTGPR